MTKIPETDFTIEWVIAKLQEKTNINAELKNWRSVRIAVGVGYTSIIILIEFEWKDNAELEKSLVLKIPDSKMTIEISKDNSNYFDGLLRHCHHNECAAYRFLAQNRDLAIPRVFHYENIDSGTPVIMMESFHHNSCMTAWSDGLSLNQLLQSVDAIAKMQAYSLKNKVSADMFLYPRKDFEGFRAVMGTGVKSLITSLDHEYFGKNLTKLNYMFESEYSYQLATKLHEKMGLQGVLVHGDLWLNNLLWERSANGKSGDHLLAIVDWQFAHVGSCCEDIARLLATSCNGQMRRSNTDKILSFYHEKLTEYMGDVDVPFSLNNVKETYNRVLPYGMVLLLFSVPFLFKGKSFEVEEREKLIAEKVNDIKMLMDDVMRLEESRKY